MLDSNFTQYRQGLSDRAIEFHPGADLLRKASKYELHMITPIIKNADRAAMSHFSFQLDWPPPGLRWPLKLNDLIARAVKDRDLFNTEYLIKVHVIETLNARYVLSQGLSDKAP